MGPLRTFKRKLLSDVVIALWENQLNGTARLPQHQGLQSRRNREKPWPGGGTEPLPVLFERRLTAGVSRVAKTVRRYQ